MFEENLYNRQEKLNLNYLDKIAIIGVGGIGSWVAFFAALSGRIKEIELWDPDKIEMTNLNRTPFRLEDVGKYKVDAICQIIDERRMNSKMDLVRKKEKALKGSFGNKYEFDYNVIIDCRDGLYVEDFEEIKSFAKVIKLSYDGLSVTYDSDFANRGVWGETRGTYTIDPSFLCPCTFLATMVITDILTNMYSKRSNSGWKKRIITFDTNATLDLLTESREIIEKDKIEKQRLKKLKIEEEEAIRKN